MLKYQTALVSLAQKDLAFFLLLHIVYSIRLSNKQCMHSFETLYGLTCVKVPVFKQEWLGSRTKCLA